MPRASVGVGSTPTKTRANGERKVTFLPDPERRQRFFTVISVDDHLVEPPWMFEGRVPGRFADRAPRVVDLEAGGQAWVYDGQVLPTVGFAAVVGRPVEEYSSEAVSFDEMRRGAYDVKHRLADMDLDGVWASLNFPSHLAGFGGGRLQTIVPDQELAFHVVRAWNDWNLEEWAGGSGGRLIPCQLPYLHDPEVAAKEIRRNAERGFTAVTFPEAPDELGFPGIFTDHWDPFMRACEETGTVVCVHVGSAGMLPPTREGAPPDVIAVLFGMYALNSTVDWLYSMLPVRFPGLKICQSEGGIGWVVGLLDRLDHTDRKHRAMWGTWPDDTPTPSEVLQRNFWFCLLEDPSSMPLRHRIGIDHILVEVDYPHADSTWPDSQANLKIHLDGLPDDEIDKLTWRNAADLFRIDVPNEVVADPNSF